MINKSILALVFILILFSSLNGHSQNLSKVESYSLAVFYSDDAQKFKNILSTKSDIENIIKWKVSKIKNNVYLSFDSKTIQLNLSYEIFKNYESSDEQYYGAIILNAYRPCSIPEYKLNFLNLGVYFDCSYFVMSNPSNESVKQLTNQIIENLISSFGLKYYEDNNY